jgi:hypothetical protein
VLPRASRPEAWRRLRTLLLCADRRGMPSLITHHSLCPPLPQIGRPFSVDSRAGLSSLGLRTSSAAPRSSAAFSPTSPSLPALSLLYHLSALPSASIRLARASGTGTSPLHSLSTLNCQRPLPDIRRSRPGREDSKTKSLRRRIFRQPVAFKSGASASD